MNEANMQPNTEEKVTEIDLVDLGRAVIRKIWLVLILLAVGAILAFTITKFFVTPMYRATSTIYILSRTTSITSLADLQVGKNLAADFEIIATTRKLLEKVIIEEELDMSYEKLKSEISVTNPTDSHMLRISVTDPDPVRAAQISNAVADELRDEISEVMNTDRPSSVEQAVVPQRKYSPSTTRNVAIGAVVGIVLALIIIIAMYLSDDTIKDSDDVRKYLGLDTLAAFPLIRGQDTKDKKSKRA